MTERMPAWLDGTEPGVTQPVGGTKPGGTRQDRPTLRQDRPTLLDQPHEQPYVRGVAAVPPVSGVAGPVEEDLGDMPVVPAPRQRRAAPAPPPGMVVRRRGRQLRSGGEWTTTGLSFAMICWGIWAVSERGGDLSRPVVTLAMVLATAVFVFTMSRLVGRTVLERILGRQRRSAWPSHLATGVFLAAAGLTFLQQTRWVIDAWAWLTDHFPT